MAGSSKEFNGTPFVAGDVRGLRLWNPHFTSDDRVVLKSVYRMFLWGAAHNDAICSPLGTRAITEPRLIRTTECEQDHHHSVDDPYHAQDLRCHRPHLEDGMDPGCSCGFYAYTRNITDNPYLKSDKGLHVEGIIQGWGRTVIGTKGFRCSKARILALVLPCHIHDELAQAVREQAEKVNAYLPLSYPGIPIYTSRAAMLEEIPLTDGASVDA